MLIYYSKYGINLLLILLLLLININLLLCLDGYFIKTLVELNLNHLYYLFKK
jgi:hypothetical protein